MIRLIITDDHPIVRQGLKQVFELSLSPKNVSTYKQRLLTKLDLKTTADIVRYAINEGVIN